jgi:hypothetical protein
VRLFGILAISFGVLSLVSGLLLAAPGDARRKARLLPWYFYGMASLAVVLAAYIDIRGIELAMWAVLIFGIATFNFSLARLCRSCGRVTFGTIGKASVSCAACGATVQKMHRQNTH